MLSSKLWASLPQAVWTKGQIKHFTCKRLKDKKLQTKAKRRTQCYLHCSWLYPWKLSCMYSYTDRQMQPTECSPQLTPKLTGGRSTCAFLTYIRDSVRNTVACMFGSKTLCLFRHFYLLERRKILRILAPAQFPAMFSGSGCSEERLLHLNIT